MAPTTLAIDFDAGCADALDERQHRDQALSVTRANLRLPTCTT